MIKFYFQSNHKVGIHKDIRYHTIHYTLSISGKPAIEKIQHHFTLYPLLGAKKLSFSI